MPSASALHHAGWVARPIKKENEVPSLICDDFTMCIPLDNDDNDAGDQQKEGEQDKQDKQKNDGEQNDGDSEKKVTKKVSLIVKVLKRNNEFFIVFNDKDLQITRGSQVRLAFQFSSKSK